MWKKQKAECLLLSVSQSGIMVVYLSQAFLISKHRSIFRTVTRMGRASDALAFYCMESAQVHNLIVGISLLMQNSLCYYFNQF